jgi:hypothetical protein
VSCCKGASLDWFVRLATERKLEDWPHSRFVLASTTEPSKLVGLYAPEKRSNTPMTRFSYDCHTGNTTTKNHWLLLTSTMLILKWLQDSLLEGWKEWIGSDCGSPSRNYFEDTRERQTALRLFGQLRLKKLLVTYCVRTNGTSLRIGSDCGGPSRNYLDFAEDTTKRQTVPCLVCWNSMIVGKRLSEDPVNVI